MKNICIVVPTHERHDYLTRSIDYFKNFGCKVVICDSSGSAYQTQFPENIYYYHLQGAKFSEKILFAIAVCNTDYIALCPDDDFLFEDALIKGASILDNTHTVQACVGEVIMFHETSPFRVVAQTGWQASDFGAARTPEERISAYLSNYQQVLWSLFRSNALKQCFEIIRDAGYENENFFELTIATICAGRGGIHLMNDYWIIRELSHKAHWGTRHQAVHLIKNLSTNKDANTFVKLMNQLLFDGAGELALSKFVEQTNGKSKVILFIKKVFLKLTFKKTNLISLDSINIDCDARFAPIRKAFELHQRPENNP